MDFNNNYKDLCSHQSVSADVVNVTKATHERLLSETQEQGMQKSSAHQKSGNESVSINQEGSIYSANLPGDWNSTRENLAIRTLTRLHPKDDESVSISMIQPGRPITAAAAEAFHSLLNQPAHTLSPDEVKSVEKVMNTLNAGDNQYTNSAQPGDRYAPNFRLSGSRTGEINGKPVLEVEGSFVNQMGNPTDVFKGIFIDRDGTGTSIQGVALDAPDSQRYSQYSTAFENMLQSIKWSGQ